ncbi:MAG: von Willebrand factor type A domain-containing protein [Bacteroidetes bacterium]|nr:von Willebrand factor type A domain-containing protein [Bacteroidota bacterium]
MKARIRHIILFAFAALPLLGSGANVQPIKFGTIYGTVSDSTSHQPLAGSTVLVIGTTLGAIADVNGKYKITNIPVGTYDLQSSFVGYHSLVKKSVVVCNQCEVRLEFKLIAGLDLYEELIIDYERPLIRQDALGVKKMRELNAVDAVQAPLYRVEGRFFDGRFNHAPFNTEEYAYIEEAGFLNPRISPLSTFSIDVDAASYSNMRRFITTGQRPPVDAIRTEELVNYFDYDYPLPGEKHPVSIYSEVGLAPWNPDNLLMHIGLQAKQLTDEELRPSNLVFLLDVSGSMDSENKIHLLKKSFKLLINELTARDRVAIVVYAGAAGLVLPSTRGDRTDTIWQALEQLQAGGSTAGGAGIKLAYQVASDNLIPDGNNRVILATDGDFNIGVSDTGALVRLLKERKKEGIGLTVLGFGGGNLKDSRLEALADKGDGNYYYIDSILEGKKVFVDQLRSTLYTVAKDVKIQVEFNPAVVGRYRLIGYENRALNAEDFVDDKKDAGEMGSGHTVTALYELVLADNIEASDVQNLRYQESGVNQNYLDELGTVKVRYKLPDSDESIELDHIVSSATSENTSSDFRFSASVAMFSMLLRDSSFLGETSASSILDLARASKGDDKFGYRAEFIRLVETYSLFDIVDAGMVDHPTVE